MELGPDDFLWLGFYLEGFFLGLYSGLFAIYLRYRAFKQDQGRNNAKNIFFFAICVLYASSVAIIFLDIAIVLVNIDRIVVCLQISQIIVFACCDFIAQSILIYRCWIVWSCNLHVVIIPSFLAFAFLVIWIVGGIAPDATMQGQLSTWVITQSTGVALSMTVNTLVTGLIVFRIFRVFQQVKGITGGARHFPSIIFILIESGMPLFFIQLARLVLDFVMTDAANNAYNFVISIHPMLNGITPTIIMLRVLMGTSFHSKNSLLETVGSLHFAALANPNSTSETKSVSSVNEKGGNDDIGIRSSDDLEIQMVQRS